MHASARSWPWTCSTAEDWERHLRPRGPYVALAQAQADAGKSDDAMRTLELGLSTRRLDNAQAAWGPIHHLLVSARIAARLGHAALRPGPVGGAHPRA